jgi:hypothetical protein
MIKELDTIVLTIDLPGFGLHCIGQQFFGHLRA